MLTLREYETYLRVQKIIDSCNDEAEIISKLKG